MDLLTLVKTFETYTLYLKYGLLESGTKNCSAVGTFKDELLYLYIHNT